MRQKFQRSKSSLLVIPSPSQSDPLNNRHKTQMKWSLRDFVAITTFFGLGIGTWAGLCQRFDVSEAWDAGLAYILTLIVTGAIAGGVFYRTFFVHCGVHFLGQALSMVVHWILVRETHLQIGLIALLFYVVLWMGVPAFLVAFIVDRQTNANRSKGSK